MAFCLCGLSSFLSILPVPWARNLPPTIANLRQNDRDDPDFAIIRVEAKDFNFLAPTSVDLDLRDFTKTQEYFSKHMPEFVIHTAGLVGGIQANMARPVDFLVENVDLGRNVIMASKSAGVKNLLNLSSSCMYPRNAINPLTENLILQGELEPTNEGYALA